MKVLFLTNVLRSLGTMRQAMNYLQREGSLDGSCACFWLTEATAWDANWDEEAAKTDFLLLQWMGTGLDTPFLQRLQQTLQQRDIRYYIDAAGTEEGEFSNKLTEEQLDLIRRYFLLGGESNFKNLWLCCAAFSGAKTSYEPPEPLPWCGIYHPKASKVYTDLAEYEAAFCRPGLPALGIIFYRDEWVWNDLAYQKALAEEAERQGLNAVCVFTNGMPVPELGMPSLKEVFDRFFSKGGVSFIDCLLNTTKFSLTAGGALPLTYLEKRAVPILAAYTLMQEYKEWADNYEGLSPMEAAISVSLPEFDGVLHGVPVACKKVLPNGDVCYLPIAERAAQMVKKAKKWALLRRKQNSEKKIAVIFHNYPPRNSNIGSALGLDSIESVRRLLALLKERGYKVDSVPADTKDFIAQLTASATNDKNMLDSRRIEEAMKLSAAAYKKFYECLPVKTQKELARDWGEAPGEVMNIDGSLLVPGTVNGNIFITVQPPRGFGEDPAKLYHDPDCAPTHHYLAVYRWLKEVWQADAVLHIGTHGSLEWLPGKNAALSAACYPAIAIAELPNIYPYNMTIVGEGLQAKRRGGACLIDHLPAPQSRADVYDELEEIEKLLDEYAYFAPNSPEEAAQAEKLLLAKAEVAHLTDDVPYDPAKPFKEYASSLHNYLSELKSMEVHVGLHILGRPPQKELLLDQLWLLTRRDNGKVMGLEKIVASLYGVTCEELTARSAELYRPLQLTYGRLADKIYEEGREVLRLLQEGGFTSAAVEKVLNLPQLAGAEEALREKMRELCLYINETVYPALKATEQEMKNLLRALEGQYVEPGPGGSPASAGCELLPSGRNFYGVDPRSLPTPAAWEAGKILGDQVIERFIAEEGRYPESVGIVLWAGSNMRSRGQCAAEFLYLLGLRPRYQKGSLRVTGLEIIPLDELRRPRIDVVGRISGLLRDSMPSVTELLDQGAQLAASLDEPPEQNYVRAHALADAAELRAGGMKKEEAWRQACYRIFGDPPGTYGAGVPELLEAKNWQTVDDIASVYVRWGGHAYGGSARGVYLPELFRKRLSSVDIAVKNDDNHDTNMLASDDYNAYHGGLIAAVRSVRGKAPKGYSGDSSDRSRIALHSVEEQAKRIFRSEAINPKFIKGMMEHGYKGAADMANMVAHSYQWDATSGVLEDWMYEGYAEKYAFDPKVQAWLREVNPWALQRMTEVLLEAEQRGLWNARPETAAKLRELYLSMEGDLEELNDR